MINCNGTLLKSDEKVISAQNRAFKYADALFETIKVINGTICFSEDHYFRLMASMRMLRMEIPSNFTLDFFENEIKKLLVYQQLQSAKIRITVFRSGAGLYLPTTNDIEYVIEASPLKINIKESYTIDVFKDFYVYSGWLSTLKTTSKQVHIAASIYANENGFDNCVLLNDKKNVVEATNGNIFIVKNNVIKTPPLTEGCIKGILRKKLLETLKRNPNYQLEEAKISPFELQKADEVFITNAILGIQPVSQYKRTIYKTEVAKDLTNEINRLSQIAQIQ